jgi:acyl-coenzyme A thioesterase PaaI-like protein
VTDILARFVKLRETGDCTELIDAIPYSKWMGMTFDVSSGELVGTLRFSDMLIGNPVLPALHGGTIAALLESTAIFAIFLDAGSVVLPKTINQTVEYLRSGKPVDTHASAVITKRGRRVINVRAEAWQDDRSRPIATAFSHFLVKGAEG